MITKILLIKKCCKLLHEVFPMLQLDTTIYAVPRITPVPGMQNFEIQVCTGTSEFERSEGAVVSQQLVVQVGVFITSRLDAYNKHSTALMQQATSIYTREEQVATKLNGSFLYDPLTDFVQRPLVLRGISGVYDSGQGQLYSVVEFDTGIMTERILPEREEEIAP